MAFGISTFFTEFSLLLTLNIYLKYWLIVVMVNFEDVNTVWMNVSKFWEKRAFSVRRFFKPSFHVLFWIKTTILSEYWVSGSSKNKIRLTPYSQLTFTCSNSTVETLGKGVKYVQS